MPEPPESSQEITANRRSGRRQRRAEALRRRALSPLRILLMVLMLPVTTFGIALGVYLRTSPYEPAEAVLHIVALAGCDAAQAVGIAPAYRGGLGYHERNDPDGDGVACGVAVETEPQSAATGRAPEAKERMLGGAKFLRP